MTLGAAFLGFRLDAGPDGDGAAAVGRFQDSEAVTDRAQRG
jgi:hypothetical protein